jgi:hypothetical protein
MMVPDFVKFAWRLGVGGHAQEVLEHSDCFHGRYYDFWPPVASRSVPALYYQFTSTMRVDIIGGCFCSIAIGELGESYPGRRYRTYRAPLSAAYYCHNDCLPIWRSRQRRSRQSSFVFISMTIVT